MFCYLSAKSDLNENLYLIEFYAAKTIFCLKIPKLKNQSHFLENLVVAKSSRYFSGKLSYFCSWYCMICLVMSITHQRLTKRCTCHYIDIQQSDSNYIQCLFQPGTFLLACACNIFFAPFNLQVLSIKCKILVSVG